VEGRLPLGDAAFLFPNWPDTTDAERMNYWLNVLSENALLISQSIAELPELTGPGSDEVPSCRPDPQWRAMDIPATR